MSKVIEVKKLNKSYGSTKVLDNLSFEVEKGEILGLLGPNGSGKTTTINSILSLLNYESGTIKIMGKNMTPDSFDIKKNIGVIFQDVAVFDELSVLILAKFSLSSSFLIEKAVDAQFLSKIRFSSIILKSLLSVAF